MKFEDLEVGVPYHMKISHDGHVWEGIGWRPFHHDEELVMMFSKRFFGEITGWFNVDSWKAGCKIEQAVQVGTFEVD